MNELEQEIKDAEGRLATKEAKEDMLASELSDVEDSIRKIRKEIGGLKKGLRDEERLEFEYRGIHCDVREFKQRYGEGFRFHWCFYITLDINQLPRYIREAGEYTSYENELQNLPWHGSITYDDLEEELLTLGCDYNHGADQGEVYKMRDIKMDLIDVVDAYLELKEKV